MVTTATSPLVTCNVRPVGPRPDTYDFSVSERTTSSNTYSRLTAATTGYVNQLGVVAVIPPESQSCSQSRFDEHLYREHHRVENLSAKLKSFRRIATRYDKLLRSFAAFVSLAYIIVWLRY